MILAAVALAVALADSTDAGHVRIATTVTDRQGRPVSGLTAKDFEIKEDGVVQKIDAVEPRRPEARRIAILLDEFHVDPADTARVREAITDFVDTRLRPGDLALVLKPMDPLTAIRLTADRDALRQAIAGFEGRKGIYEPRTPFEAETLGSAPALVEAGRAQVVLSALRALTGQLGAEPGRSAILLVTEGFTQARRALSHGLPDAGIVERFANRYDVPIYAFDPRPAMPDDDAGAPLLSRLVSETGGTLTRGGDLAAGVRRAADELDGGYTVVYTAVHGNDWRFHPVEVSLPKRQADARTRAGYVSLPSEATRRAMRDLLDDTPRLPPRLLKHSPLLNVWSGVTRIAANEATVAVTWQPAVNAKAAARVALKATTPDGKLLFEGLLAPVVVGEPGEDTRAEFPAPGGRVQLDMTVLGIAGQKLDTDVRDVEIPRQSAAAPLLLPPIFIATQSAREFRELAANGNAPPLPGQEFRRTERLLIRVPAYAGGAPAPVTAVLLNRVGQTMRTLDVLPGDTPGVTQFDLPLAPLAPGDYFLQFTIQSSGGPVSRRVSFKVTG